MRRVFLFLLIFLIPAGSDAAYNIYLKNGSVISDAVSYEEKGDDIKVYLEYGSLQISKKDILKIESFEPTFEDSGFEETRETTKEEEGLQTIRDSEVTGGVVGDDKIERFNALKSELDAGLSELRALELEEARLVREINEKKGNRAVYNFYQLKQMEKEIEPMHNALISVQTKKEELIQRIKTLEDEIRKLQ